MISRRLLYVLVSAAAILPVAIAVVLATARLLSGMNDAPGAQVLDRVSLALGILWAINLIALLIALGIAAIDRE